MNTRLRFTAPLVLVLVPAALTGCPASHGVVPTPVSVPENVEPVAIDECASFRLVAPQPPARWPKLLPRAKNVVARCEDESVCKAEVGDDAVVVARGVGSGSTLVHVAFDNPTNGEHEEGRVRVTFVRPPAPNAYHPRLVGAHACPKPKVAPSASIAQPPRIDPAVAAATAETVFIGRIVEVGRPPGFWSGIAPALQSVTFDVERVVVGNVPQSRVTVFCLMVGGGDGGRVVSSRASMTPEYSQIGERYIVPTKYWSERNEAVI